MKNSRLVITTRHAYTLIEMMLVIALVAVLATLGISAYQKTTEQSKIDKSALQIQQLLQAGMAYYVDYGCWPAFDPNNNLCKQTPPPDFNPFIPIAGKTSPWGSPYNWGNVDDYGRLFFVSTFAPDQLTANRLAAKLPNAYVQPSGNPQYPYMILAEVGVPGSANTNENFKVLAMGSVTLNPDGTTALPIPYPGRTDISNYPACPSGMDPNLFLAASNFQTEETSFVFQAVAQPVYTLNCNYSTNGNNWDIKLVYQKVGGPSFNKKIENMGNSATCFYVVACVKPTNTFQQTTTPAY